MVQKPKSSQKPALMPVRRLFRCFFRDKSTPLRREVASAVEDASSTAEGAGPGESNAVQNAAIVLAESSPACEASSSGIDEASPSAAPAPEPSLSAYHSARIERMIKNRSKFKGELEFQMANSHVHWSELSRGGASSSGESGSSTGVSGSSGGASGSGNGGHAVDHRKFFQKLQKDEHWGKFCSEVVDVELGNKLGEGAQGVIYEAQVTFVPEKDWSRRHAGVRFGYVVKVMKAACPLEDLYRQWPRGIASLQELSGGSMTLYGALVKDHATEENRFGFVMRRYCGDLRQLIDLRMISKNAEGPPFTILQARDIILTIASHMQTLHTRGIIHRDLKASNVLISPARGLEKSNLVYSDYEHMIFPYVADWECSMFIVGTGLWRAPEILLQLKNRIPGDKVVMDKAADVYGFGMTCYEIVTGLLPFETGLLPYEDLPFEKTRDAILDGLRPELPHDMNPTMKTIITSCWDPNPTQRPTFSELVKTLFKPL